MTNSSKLVAPIWGAERMLGTNPIAIAFPALREPPIVIDMATSTVAYGKIEIAMRKGQPLEDGWAVDSTGSPTSDLRSMIEGGALLPLGGDRTHGGHKGYCLSAMVDILCGVLSGETGARSYRHSRLVRKFPAAASARESAISLAPSGSTVSSSPTNSSARSTNGFACSARPRPPLAPAGPRSPATLSARHTRSDRGKVSPSCRPSSTTCATWPSKPEFRLNEV